MRLILTDDVYEVGSRGDVVDVTDGFGRNFLLPRKLALLATPGNLKMMEQQKEAFARKEAKHRDEAELLARELSQSHILISRKSGETGVLFGSVTSKDIGDVLEQTGIHLDRRRILLPQPLKSIGTTRIEARPHREVEATLLISVLPEEEEPVAKVIQRGVDSDKIIEDLEEKVRKIEQAEGAEAEVAPEAVGIAAKSTTTEAEGASASEGASDEESVEASEETEEKAAES